MLSRKIWFESDEQKWGEIKEIPNFWKICQLIRIREYVIRITRLLIIIKKKMWFESNGSELTWFLDKTIWFESCWKNEIDLNHVQIMIRIKLDKICSLEIWACFCWWNINMLWMMTTKVKHKAVKDASRLNRVWWVWGSLQSCLNDDT